MKSLRLAVLTVMSSAYCFGASKEIVELQRDVALLQDKLSTVQRTLDEKFSALQLLLQQQSENTSKTNQQMQNLEVSVPNAIDKRLGSANGVTQKVDTVSEDVRALRDSLNDLNARLDRMDAKITDIKNAQQIQQNPPAAPPPAGTQPGGPQAGPGGMTQVAPTAPPAGMSAEKSYTDARRDLQAGNNDLALKEFQDYLTYFPSTELAPNAQFYVGQIAYNKGDYAAAIEAFDAVLERYPQNPKTSTAHLMKGQALLKSGQRTRAAQEFRECVSKFPRTDDAKQAQYQLRAMGTANATSSRRKEN
jgi:tol-pal system protein YbgF